MTKKLDEDQINWNEMYKELGWIFIIKNIHIFEQHHYQFFLCLDRLSPMGLLSLYEQSKVMYQPIKNIGTKTSSTSLLSILVLYAR